MDYGVCGDELEEGGAVGEGGCGGVFEGECEVFGYVGVGGEICVVWPDEGHGDGGEVGGAVG